MRIERLPGEGLSDIHRPVYHAVYKCYCGNEHKVIDQEFMPRESKERMLSPCCGAKGFGALLLRFEEIDDPTWEQTREAYGLCPTTNNTPALRDLPEWGGPASG